jgi:predicted CopG family antitoxin
MSSDGHTDGFPDEETRVRVSKETWRRLNARKEPGDSFDDVLDRLLARNDDAVVPDWLSDDSGEQNAE